MTYQKYIARYVIGFVGALLLSVAMFLLSQNHALSARVIVLGLMVLAAIQMIVQVLFFLHIREDDTFRWKFASLVFTILIVLIIGLISLWIMMNLNYRMGMSPEAMKQYMLEQNKEGF